jgi:hypothetical protein
MIDSVLSILFFSVSAWTLCWAGKAIFLSIKFKINYNDTPWVSLVFLIFVGIFDAIVGFLWAIR